MSQDKPELLPDVGCVRATELYRTLQSGDQDALSAAVVERHRLETQHESDCFVNDPQE